MRLTLLIAVFCAPLFLYTKTPIHIEGTVVTAGDSPIAGAFVSMAASETDETFASTDEKGQFSLDLPAETPILLRIGAAGFVEKLVLWQGIEPLRIVLEPVPPVDSETVTASRRIGRELLRSG
jgi:hypothetical protein